MSATPTEPVADALGPSTREVLRWFVERPSFGGNGLPEEEWSIAWLYRVLRKLTTNPSEELASKMLLRLQDYGTTIDALDAEIERATEASRRLSAADARCQAAVEELLAEGAQ